MDVFWITNSIPQLNWCDRKKTYRVYGNKSLLCYTERGVASLTQNTGGVQWTVQVYTLQMGIPVPYCIYSEVSQEEIVCHSKRWCERNHQNVVQVQESGNHCRGGMRRSCAFVREHTVETDYLGFCGISQRKVGADDLWQASGIGEQMWWFKLTFEDPNLKKSGLRRNWAIWYWSISQQHSDASWRQIKSHQSLSCSSQSIWITPDNDSGTW